MLYGYARVSSDTQNLDMQIDALKKYGCSEQNIFTDKMSGIISNSARPAWAQLEKKIKRGDTLVVRSLCRLGRSATGLISLFEKLKKDGVNLVSIENPIDSSTSAGKFQANILACFAELHRDYTRELCAAGIKAARDRGVKFGRSPATTDEQDKLIISMRKTFCVEDIAKAMNVSRRTVFRRLKSLGDQE